MCSHIYYISANFVGEITVVKNFMWEWKILPVQILQWVQVGHVYSKVEADECELTGAGLSRLNVWRSLAYSMSPKRGCPVKQYVKTKY